MRDVDRILQRLKLSDLRLLQAVVACGGMAKAAAQLNISQPAVSKAISALEHNLGVRLLDRTSTGVRPTVYGEALLQGSLTVFDDLRQSISRIEFISDPSTGAINVGATEPGAAGFVPVVIDRFMQQHPRVHVRVVTGDPDRLVECELRRHSVELAIGAAPALSRSNDIELTPLFEDRHGIVAGVHSKWARRRKIPLSEIIEEPWVLPSSESPAGLRVAQAFRDCGMELPPRHVETLSISLCHHLLATGRYIATMPIVMTKLGRHLPFKPLPVDFPDLRRPITVMTLKNRTMSALGERFRNCATQVAKELGLKDW